MTAVLALNLDVATERLKDRTVVRMDQKAESQIENSDLTCIGVTSYRVLVCRYNGKQYVANVPATKDLSQFLPNDITPDMKVEYFVIDGPVAPAIGSITSSDLSIVDFPNFVKTNFPNVVRQRHGREGRVLSRDIYFGSKGKIYIFESRVPDTKLDFVEELNEES